MKKHLTEYIESLGKNIKSVFDAKGNVIKFKNMQEDTEYFLLKIQTNTDKSRESFKKAIGYVKEIKPVDPVNIDVPVDPVNIDVPVDVIVKTVDTDEPVIISDIPEVVADPAKVVKQTKSYNPLDLSDVPVEMLKPKKKPATRKKRIKKEVK